MIDISLFTGESRPYVLYCISDIITLTFSSLNLPLSDYHLHPQQVAIRILDL